MTAAVVPFRSSAQRQADAQIRAEAERVRRGYVERRASIEALLAGIEASAAREEGR